LANGGSDRKTCPASGKNPVRLAVDFNGWSRFLNPRRGWPKNRQIHRRLKLSNRAV